MMYLWLEHENEKQIRKGEMRRDGRAPELVNLGTFEDLCDHHPDWRHPILRTEAPG